ncbi:hypothetical protein A6A07_30645 [Streptomyces sp. CB03911]|nr:hypothetical protein A6A07_30645 [Streptomyces sp. CB03911]
MTGSTGTLARERGELVRGRSGVHERTAGTRVAPMPPDRGGDLRGDGRQDGEPEPDGVHGLHLFGHRSASR